MIQIKNYPKVYQKYKDFIRSLLNVWVTQAVGENINNEELTDEYLETVADAMIGSQPRLLYDFLDENETYININNFGGEWGYSIDGASGLPTFSSRKEAETEAFNSAFKILEGIL